MSTTTGADTAREELLHLIAVGRHGTAYTDYPRDHPVAKVMRNNGRPADAVLAAGWRPPARVISGDVEAVTAALDGLPVGSIITCDAEHGGGLVYHKRGFPLSAPTWYETGFSARVRIATIARHQVPITVLREGTRA